MPFRFEHELRVRFRDLDGMGHVNHAVYLTYLEETRIAYFLRLFGHPQAFYPFGFVVARVEADYRRPAGLGEALRTRCRVARFGRTSFDFEYETDDAEGRPVVRARTVQVFVDEGGRPRTVPADFRATVEAFESANPKD